MPRDLWTAIKQVKGVGFSTTDNSLVAITDAINNTLIPGNQSSSAKIIRYLKEIIATLEEQNAVTPK